MMMALCNSRNHNHPLLFSGFLLVIVIVIVILPPFAISLSFNFSTFSPSEIRLEGDASISAGGAIQVIGYPAGKSRTGRASYTKPVRLRDKATRNLTDFRTHFSFNTSSSSSRSSSSSSSSSVLAFFLAPKDSTLPTNATTYLGSASASVSVNNRNSTSASSNAEDQIFAIEFNAVNPSSQPTVNGSNNNNSTYRDEVCVAFDNTSVNGARRRANVWITYNSTTHNLSIFFTYAENPVFRGNSTLFYIINLGNYLPDLVKVGFGASSSGSNAISYSVLDWEFNSTLDIKESDVWKRRLMVAASSGGGTALLVIFSFIVWKNRNSRNSKNRNSGGGRRKDGSVTLDAPIDNDFEKTSGPKSFAYGELVRSTNNFAEEGKLGEGGFGAVYRGFLADQNKDVAVKKVSKKSKQGVKEFRSEVKIISRLRHRNLVQLVGWCHHKEELLLVYEFMPNGSLDSHLFRAKTLLTWEARNKIVLGLASALLYLHEEWDQCVVHRDIKPSNIMLDSNFNAKLGDFGLARLIDHEKTSRMTILAGTLGYMAPETATTWKASKESDVYSFGIVALEIACGRKCIDSKAEEGKMVLLEWVWNLYGNGKLLKAADGKLNMDFNEQQMECLLTVGLWCAHPDFKFRPSIRQAMQVLKFEAPLPHLPPTMPVSTYAVSVPPLSLSGPPFNKSSTSHCETIGLTDFEMGRT